MDWCYSQVFVQYKSHSLSDLEVIVKKFEVEVIGLVIFMSHYTIVVGVGGGGGVGVVLGHGLSNFYTPPHNSGRVLWFHVGHLCVCHMSVCLYFHFQTIP